MKTSRPPRSGKFARYGVASTAALGAIAARAQFVGSFDVTPPAASFYGGTAGTFGTWNATLISGPTNGFVVNTTGAPSSIIIIAQDISGANTLAFTHLAPSDGTVSVDFGTSFSSGGTAFYTSDNSTFNPITAVTGTVSFPVTNGATFGFQMVSTSTYGSSAGLTLSNFSFTAIPEPAESGLLVSCAAAGFVGLMAIRAARRRANAVPPA